MVCVASATKGALENKVFDIQTITQRNPAAVTTSYNKPCRFKISAICSGVSFVNN